MARLKNSKTGAIPVEMEKLLFPVRMINTPMKANRDYAKCVIGTIDGVDTLLNCCSSRYKLEPNAAIFPKISETLDANNVQYKSEFSHIDFARFYADYTLTDKDLIYKVAGNDKDIIHPMLSISHSYNGKTMYSILFGYFRLVCSNGLTIPVQEMKQYNLAISGRHTESLEESFKELDIMLHKLVNDGKKIHREVVKIFDVMGDTWVPNVDDRIIEVAKAAKIILVDNAKFDTLADIKSRIFKEVDLLGLRGANDWLIYNGINQYINDDTLNVKAPEIRAQIDSNVLNFMTKGIVRNFEPVMS